MRYRSAMQSDNQQLRVIEDGQIRLLKDIFDDVISIAFDRYGGKPGLVATKLGMSRVTLYRRLQKRRLRGASRAE